MSENEQNEVAAPDGGLVGAIPPELVQAFFTGDQAAIGRALENGNLLERLAGHLPPRALRRFARHLNDVLDADDVVDGEPVEVDEQDIVPPVPRRAPPRRPESGAARRRVVDPDLDPTPVDVADVADEEDEGGESQTDRLNQLGAGIGNVLSELPGVALGITFLGGGRKVRISFFYPETREAPMQILAQQRVHVARFGDAMEALAAQTEDIVLAEVEGDEDGDEDEDYDSDDADGTEPEPEPEPAPRRQRR